MEVCVRYLTRCTDFMGRVATNLAPNANDMRIAAENSRQMELQKLIDTFGEVHPEFHQGSLQQALRDAEAQHKFLFVFFHSPQHTDSVDFCRDILFGDNPALLQYLAQDFLVWFGNVETLEASKAMSAFNVTTFPYVSIVTCVSRPRVLVNLMGRFSGDELLANVVSVMGEYGQEQENHRVQVAQTIENRQIMSEQRSEYEEALLADQERERQRERERAAREAAERQAREEEERKEREEEQRRLELERLKSSLPEEPSAGAGVLELAIRLPNGASVARRFAKDQKLQLVYAFIDIEADKLGVALGDYVLVDFRRKQFTQRQESVAESGIEGNMRLLVHQL